MPRFFCKSDAVDALANIGYSLLASDVAGILFDLGGNYTTRKNDKKEYDDATYTHSELLPDLIHINSAIGEELGIKRFEEMPALKQLSVILCEQSLDTMKSEAYLTTIDDLYTWMNLIKEESENLLTISYMMHENEGFNEK